MGSDAHWIKSPPMSSLFLPSPLPPWARFSLVNSDFKGAVPLVIPHCLQTFQGSPLPKVVTLQQGPIYPVCRHMPEGRPWDAQDISSWDGKDFSRNAFHYRGIKLKMRLKQELGIVTYACIPSTEVYGYCDTFKASLIHIKSSSLARIM